MYCILTNLLAVIAITVDKSNVIIPNEMQDNAIMEKGAYINSIRDEAAAPTLEKRLSLIKQKNDDKLHIIVKQYLECRIAPSIPPNNSN